MSGVRSGLYAGELLILHKRFDAVLAVKIYLGMKGLFFWGNPFSMCIRGSIKCYSDITHF